MGLHSFSRRQLASRHHPVAHARLPIVRRKPGSASFQQRRHSRTRRHRVISYFGLADCKNLARRICRHCLRHSSATSGIGAMDRPAQRCPERFILALTLLAWSNHACRKSLARYLIALLAAALGTLSKPMLVTIPFVLLLIDYWPLDRFQKEKIISLILEKIPFALFAAASAVAMVLAQHGQIDTFGFSLPLRFENAIVS